MDKENKGREKGKSNKRTQTLEEETKYVRETQVYSSACIYRLLHSMLMIFFSSHMYKFSHSSKLNSIYF
jgi:hypothetical protein